MKKLVTSAAMAAITMTSLVVPMPILVSAASAEPATDWVQVCNDNAPTFSHQDKILPNEKWSWDPTATLVSTSGDGGFTLNGFAINPANRTIHALVTFDGTDYFYNVVCNAVNAGGQDNAHFTYTLTNFEVSDPGETFDGRPAVCNPALTKGSGAVTTWYEIIGTEDFRSGASCATIAAGPLQPW